MAVPMANSMFSKNSDPVMQGFDGFDPKPAYQMVPVGETRRGIKITTGADAVDVEFEPRDIARFANPRTFVPPANTPIEDHFMRLGPRTVATFDVFGQKAGQTLLTIRDRQGRGIESMVFSVKAPLRKTYSLCVLNDMRHRSPWYPPNDPTSPTPPTADATLRPMMEGVKKTYSQQANILLSEKGGRIFDFTINDKNLGDPIILDSMVRPENEVMTSFIMGKCPVDAFGADFIFIFTWDIRLIANDIVGFDPGFGAVCFVEFNSSNPFENALTTAHELGHAFKMRHNGQNLLMAGDGISRSSLLQQFEIDTANESGTIPAPPPVLVRRPAPG